MYTICLETPKIERGMCDSVYVLDRNTSYTRHITVNSCHISTTSHVDMSPGSRKPARLVGGQGPSGFMKVLAKQKTGLYMIRR